MQHRNSTCGCGDNAICNDTELVCDPCCRCIPLRLCATLEAYGCECDGASILMDINGQGEYTGTLKCGDETMDLRILIQREYDVCYWRVISEAFYIDELFEISGYGQTCEDPKVDIEAPFYLCPGKVHISKYELATIPLVADADGCTTPYCGNCQCTCKVLCYVLEGYEPKEGELKWDEYQHCWTGAFTVCLERAYDGSCLLTASDSYGDMSYDEIEISDCTSISASFSFPDGSVLHVSCKECTCWNVSGCCDCTVDKIHTYCLDSGVVPHTLHIQVTGRCGTFSGVLQRERDVNCWKGRFSIQTWSKDPILPDYNPPICWHQDDTCWLLCCGTVLTPPDRWELAMSCSGLCCVEQFSIPCFVPVAEAQSISCKPFLVKFHGYANDCLYSAEDLLEIVVTE